MKYPLATALLALSSAPLIADVYHFEVDGSYKETELDKAESDLYLLSGTYFFSGVDDSKGPLAEAAFVDRASSLSLSYGNGDAKRLKYDLETFSLGGRHINKESGLILGASYNLEQVDYKYSDNGELESFKFEAGLYIVEQGALTALFNTHRREKLDDGNDENGKELANSKDFGVQYEQLIDLSGENSLKVEGRYIYTDHEKDDYGNTESNDRLEVEADYYFTRQLSLGASLGYVNSKVDYDDDGSDTAEAYLYGINGQYFFNNQLSVYGSFERAEANDNDGDLEAIKIGLQGRF